MVLSTDQLESRSPSEKSLEDSLDNMLGPYAKIVPLFVEGSIQHADQITNARWAEKEDEHLTFRTNQSVGTADVALYTVEDDEAILYLARGYDSGNVINPFIKSPNKVAESIKRKREAKSKAIEDARWSKLSDMDEHYNPTKLEADAIKGAEDTLRVRLSNVATNRIQALSSRYELADFEINTKNLTAIYHGIKSMPGREVSLADEQLAVAERVFGQGENFQRNMKRLNSEGIESVSLTFFYAEYIKDHAKKRPIAGNCWISDSNLNKLNLNYNFHATGNSTHGRLIGEPKVDYGPIRSMLVSRDFSPEELSRRLSQRAAANIAESLEQFIWENGIIGDHPTPNYWRHRRGFLPDIKKVDYRLLARTLSSPEWSFRMDGNLVTRMAINLLNAYHNAYTLKGK